MQKYGTTRKKQSFEIFNQIASTYDVLNHTLSAGIDKGWRKKLIKELPKTKNLEILDLATGTADTAILLAKLQSVKKVIGIDLSQGMIDVGITKVKKEKLESKLTLQIGDGVKIDFEDNSFDCVTITFGIRNFYNPQESLKEIYRVLKPGGKLLIIEFGQPENLLVNKVYNLYFEKILPAIGNIVSGHSDAYTYLNKTVNDFPFGTKFQDLMNSASFQSTKFQKLTFGIAYLYSGTK